MIMKNVAEEVISINGYQLHLLPSTKFKTIQMVAKFKAPLSKSTITKRALIPFLLQQGPEKYPDKEQFQKKLDDLYGAGLSIDGAKKGNHHILSFRFEVANQQFLSGESSILDEAISLFNEVIFHPNVNEDGFDLTIFEREKETLKKRIQSVEDDKMSYANMRLIDEMCQGELYRLHVHGYEEDLESLTAKNLHDYYQELLGQDELDVFLLGDFDTDDIKRRFTSVVNRKEQANDSTSAEEQEETATSQQKPQEVIEKQAIQQAKLHLGYRTKTTFQDEDYFALHVFNGLFGGFPNSKLFINVREKNSLAYYAASRIESHKGLLLVFSGIAPEDYHKAREIIELQMSEMKEGHFSESDVDETKELIVNQLLETLDNPQGIIEMLYQQVIGEKNLTPEQLIDGIKQVTKEEVTHVAQKIEEDTVYLLTSKGEE